MGKPPILKIFTHILYTFLSFIVITIFTPFLLLFCLPIYSFRLVISLLSKILRPDLASMLEARSTIFGTEDIYNSPNSTLIVTHTIERGASVPRIINEFDRAFRITRENGSLKYKSMSEYTTCWMGFVFWAYDMNFDLRNHIKEISLTPNGRIIYNSNSNSELTWADVKNAEKQLIREAYPPKQGPWSVNILRNVRRNLPNENDKNGQIYDVIIYKVHHVLGDGFSLLKLFTLDIVLQDKSCIAMPEFPKRNCLSKLVTTLYADFRAPFDIISSILWLPEKNALHLEEEKLFGNSNFHVAESEPIPLSSIKEIKQRLGVQFKAVVIEACTGAIRNVMIRRQMHIPSTITCMVPFPYPGHPNKMGNYWSVMAVSLPVGIQDRDQRLKFISRNLSELQNSTSAITAFKMQPLIGSLFHWQLKPFAKLQHFTGLVSDFPGPLKPVMVYGVKLVDAHFLGGFPKGNVGILLFSSSYNGKWKMNALVDHALMSSDAEVQDLIIKSVVDSLSTFHTETVV